MLLAVGLDRLHVQLSLMATRVTTVGHHVTLQTHLSQSNRAPKPVLDHNLCVLRSALYHR